MKTKILAALVVAFLIAFGLQAQERISRLPVGENSIKDQIAKVSDAWVGVWEENTSSFVRFQELPHKEVWGSMRAEFRSVAEELYKELNPSWRYVIGWGCVSRGTPLFGMETKDITYFRGDQVEEAVSNMLTQFDSKWERVGFLPIWAPGVVKVRYLSYNAQTGENWTDEESPNGAVGCPSLLERAGDGWLWLPTACLRQSDWAERRFRLYYSDTEWDEFDNGFGARGDIVASSRGAVPPKIAISKLGELQAGSTGVIARIAGLVPESQYTFITSSTLPFGEDRQEWVIQADRLGVVSLTFSGQVGFVTLVTNSPSPSARRLVSPASMPLPP